MTRIFSPILALALLLLVAPTLAAQESTPAEQMKKAMVDMSSEMHAIIVDLESTDDVQEATEDIAEVFDELIESMRGFMTADPVAMQAMEAEVQSDPQIMEWNQKMDAAMQQIQTDHPEAAAALMQVMQQQSMKLMALVTEMMQDVEVMEAEAEDEGAYQN